MAKLIYMMVASLDGHTEHGHGQPWLDRTGRGLAPVYQRPRVVRWHYLYGRRHVRVDCVFRRQHTSLLHDHPQYVLDFGAAASGGRETRHSKSLAGPPRTTPALSANIASRHGPRLRADANGRHRAQRFATRRALAQRRAR